MKMIPKQMTAKLTIFFVLLTVSPGAFAYLDPSTGSMVISAIVGIVASVALALKTYWYRMKNFLRPGKAEPSPDDHVNRP